MSSQATKTNNDSNHFESKVLLRLNSLPNKDSINVLDAFGGEGRLWSEVKKRTKIKINILSIDKNKYTKTNLIGDNVKFLMSIDLNKFDIIDLDAWGSPSNQLEILYQKKYKGIVHCTFIQTMQGSINKNILKEYGYSPEMLGKCKSIFNHNGIDKMLYYCYVKFNVTRYFIHSNAKKSYFYFIIQ